MDLALPRFEGLGDGPRQVHRPWMVSTESPASPDPGCLTELLRSSSPCFNLDALSSDDTEGSVGLSNLSVLYCAARMTAIPLLIQIKSCRMRTCRQWRARTIADRLSGFVIYLRMFRLWIFLKSVGIGIPDGQCPRVAQVNGFHYPFAFWPRLRVAGLWMMLRDYRPPIELPAVGWVETIQLSPHPMSGQLSPGSPRMVAFEDLGDSSVPLSPNCVQAGRSQEVPEDGSLFNVSPVSPGFLMRPMGPLGSIQRPTCCCHRSWMVLVTRFLVTRLLLLNVHRFRDRMPL